MNNKTPSMLLLDSIEQHQTVFESLKRPEFLAAFEEAASLILKTLQSGKKLLIAGNGGSAADAQHFAAELICKFKNPRAPVPCVALTTDSSILTSVANDFSFEDIFSRQIQALGKAGDIFIALSTSGNSPNMCAGIEVAQKKSMNVIGLTGRSGGKMKNITPLLLSVKTDETARIQEAHITLLHTFCEIIDRELFEV